jgi:hypothetical protein
MSLWVFVIKPRLRLTQFSLEKSYPFPRVFNFPIEKFFFVLPPAAGVRLRKIIRGRKVRRNSKELAALSIVIALSTALAVQPAFADGAYCGSASHEKDKEVVEDSFNTLIGNIASMCSVPTNESGFKGGCGEITRQALQLSAEVRKLDEDDCK